MQVKVYAYLYTFIQEATAAEIAHLRTPALSARLDIHI